MAKARACAAAAICAATGMVAMGAMAAEVPATAGLQLRISGFLGFEAAAVLDQSGDNGFDRDYDFRSGGRLQFDVKTITDDGLEYGARIRFNNVNRRDDVTVDHAYIYLAGGFGTITLGDVDAVAGDYGYIFAHDAVVSEMGMGANWGDNLDHDYPYGGGHFFSLDPTYISGIGDPDTRIKYTSPDLGGFSFAVDFTPVVGGGGHAGNGGRADLIDDGDTLYENVVTAGANYTAEFDGASVLVSGTASTGNGVGGHRDLAAYSLGTQVAAGDVTGSLNWVHYDSIADSGKAIDTIAASLAWRFGDFEAGLGYAWTTAEKGNGLAGDEDHGDAGRSDLRNNHIAAATLVYTLAPGLNAYGELSWETASFRQGADFDNTVLGTGLVLGF
ncbi:porin [Inquilinus sp. NPDC058860]|uniref:porin n=1 Tax=Inquilinus sp. NPDC058860 TaxID=3346652 RepID=UPI0036A4134A